MIIGAVDIFCGAGGLSYGLKQSGIDIIAGIDFDDRCQFAYEHNCEAKFSKADICDVRADDINSLYQGVDIRILAGCAPCQPFSTYSQSRKSLDDRWLLLQEFQRLAVEVQPEIITMENVAKLARLPIWMEFTSALEKIGYDVNWGILNCDDFAVPQTRKRLVMLASKMGKIDLPIPTTVNRKITVRDTIGHLPKLQAGKQYLKDSLHKSSKLNSLNLERIKASKAGGTWRDWPEHLVAKCHTKKSGRSYPSVYGRMEWDRPSPTITTQFYGFGNGRFGHPIQNRGLSVREGALLQSFPDHYQFIKNGDPVTIRALGTMIGNAVPPKLGEAIGKTINIHINNYYAT
ncbi:DNA (cytosine-5-)-methyltransferase [Candidatus Wolfebacteria bacterium]|nr:MAG: DNA (cytosine-5-)-methyltransferase [Candidatus Wolfebacteria bacterium]